MLRTLITVAAGPLLAASLLFATTTTGRSISQVGYTPIFEIQGNGRKSLLVGQEVTTQGIVTAAFPDGGNDLDGFFLQDPFGDGDPATSDGIFVYDNSQDISVPVGASVVVTGIVKEHQGVFTEIVLGSAAVVQADGPEVTAQVIAQIPCDQAAGDALLESFEGMLVQLPGMRVIGATNHYGEAYSLPAGDKRAALYRGDPSLGCRVGLMRPSGWLAMDHGQVVTGPVGVLAEAHGIYKLAISDSAELVTTPSTLAPPAAPVPAASDEVTVATYNVENLFDTIDDPLTQDTVVTQEGYAVALARRARSIAMVVGLPDVIGLQEVENRDVLRALADHPLLSSAAYQSVLVEGPDGRGMDVGLLYKPGKLAMLGQPEVRQSCTARGPDGGPGTTCTLHNGGQGFLLFGRPPLMVNLMMRHTAVRLVVIVNHFKSKTGGDAATRPYRVEQAEFVRGLVEEIRMERPGIKVLVLGDLNDFEDSAMIGALTAGQSLGSLWPSPTTPGDYSYNFQGVRQILDHILMPPDQAYREFRALQANTDFAAPAPGDLRTAVQHTADHEPLFARLVVSQTAYLPAVLRAWPRDGIGGEAASPRPSATSTSVPTSTQASTAPPPNVTTTPAPTPTPTSEAGRPPRFPIRIDDIFFDGIAGSSEPDEYVEFTNVAGETVDLTGWQLVSVQGNQRYRFPTRATTVAGKTCRVYTNQDDPEFCGFNWRSSAAIWRNAGDKAELRNAAGLLVDHFCYGDWAGQCP